MQTDGFLLSEYRITQTFVYDKFTLLHTQTRLLFPFFPDVLLV